LSGPFATHTWEIKGVTQRFRYFRILQTGKNSGNTNFLSLSGIELYGELFENTNNKKIHSIRKPPLQKTTQLANINTGRLSSNLDIRGDK